MGSGNSRLGGSAGKSKVNRSKHRLSSLLCGGASSSSSSTSSSSRREDCATESLINPTDHCQHLSNDLYSSTHVSVCQSVSVSSPPPETSVSQNTSHTESSTHSKDEPVPPHQTQTDTETETETNTQPKTYHHTLDDGNITAPCTTQLPLILNSTTSAISNTDHLITNDLPSFLEDNRNFESTPIPAPYHPSIASQPHGDQALQELLTPELGLLVSDTAQPPPEESLLHVNVVSVSSNILPTINNRVTTHEARRNSRRMFWDAFSTRTSTRLAEYPALLLTTEDADSTGSRRRWLLDIGDNIFDDEFMSDSLHLDRGSRYTTDRRRNSRSEFWDRLRGAATESRHHASCPLHLHSDGSCTCELDGEASALSSISRIVLLAEALFEVLDEIHHQPNFSLSLSVPAPESVVDSLPLRTYEKPCTNCGEDVDQCYICLVEYEEGEKIRVLPCRHEYHMACVDKWLKEIHGICPLCRGEIVGKDTASSSDALAT